MAPFLCISELSYVLFCLASALKPTHQLALQVAVQTALHNALVKIY